MPAAPTEFDAATRALLTDAVEWRLLGRLLECPSAEWRHDVAELSREITVDPLAEAARLADTQGSEGLYHSVFGPGGPAPPREASYLRTLELGTLLSSIEGDYAAFAYQPASQEPPDHIAIETGFIAYLRLKEAYALASGDGEAAGIARRAADRFLIEHLAVVAHPVSELLAESGIHYLAQASSIVAARTGPRPKPRELPVVQHDADDDAGGEVFSCDL